MKVAIPQFGEIIAPRFEAARHFAISVVEGGKTVSTRSAECTGPEGYRRIRLLQIHGIHTLICNGIKGSYRDMLMASGISVIHNVSGPAGYALAEFARGALTAEVPPAEIITARCEIPHQELVIWARDLFVQHGYSVTGGPGQDAFLVDLAAGIMCPVCGKLVRAAICCGAHTYNCTQEIVEFHHRTPSEYDARVYVCPINATVERYCREYGIELLDPTPERIDFPARAKDKLPILRGPVRNHERASLISEK